VAFVEKQANLKCYNKGSITVALGGSILSSFLQPYDFYTAQNIAVLVPNIQLTDEEKLYYCAAIKSNAYKYSTFGREANRTLKSLLLPSPTSLPGWVDNLKIEHLDHMKLPLLNTKVLLQVHFWNRFSYDEVFDIRRGESAYLQDMELGNIPYISATSKNNGVSGYVRFANSEGNIITLNYDGSIGEAFYHDAPVFISEKVAALSLKDYVLNKYVAMFLIALIRLEKFRFNYGIKWSINSRMKKSVINLPVNEQGFADYDFMEKYIKSLRYSSSI
jgi:hypothetical protein